MDIVRGANKEIDDLPKLGEYMNNNGRSTICLDWCLGIYSYIRKGKCHFRHGAQKIAHELCQVLVPGVQHILTHGSMDQGPPKKETKRLRVTPSLWGCWAVWNKSRGAASYG